MLIKIKKLLFLILFAIISYYLIDTAIAYKNTGQIVSSAFEKYGTNLTLSDFGEDRLEILLKVEDPNFYNHKGIDLKTKGAGITTITQGMVKYLYFDKFKQGIPKIRQSLIAVFALDKKISKDDQLLLFINSVYLGEVEGKEIRGFENAAQAYFAKSFSQLNEEEYLSLVSMIIGPSQYNPITNPEKLNNRVERIKKLLNSSCEPINNRDVYYQNCD